MQNSPNEPRWLPVEEVVATNLQLVEETGEPHAIRDLGLLESACAIPANRWWYGDERDPVVLAVAPLVGIAHNHPFVQGNKRTGLMAALQFLEANGIVALPLPEDETLADLIVSELDGSGSEAEVAAHLRSLLANARL